MCLGLMAMMAFSIASADAATLTLQWDPNPEPTIAGYIVSSGTRSGDYTRTTDVGVQTSMLFEAPTSPAVYYFVVRAYNSAGMQSAPSAEVHTGPWPAPLALTNIGVGLSAPQVVETTIAFRAVAVGGVMPYHYKWLIDDGTTWSLGADWSTSDTFSWRPVAANANYRVGVWVRSATSTQDAPDNSNAGSSIPFAIIDGKGTVATISASHAAPQTVRTSIRFTATVAGHGTYQYKWWVFDGLSWRIEKEWSEVNALRWAPTTPNASYQILVRVQNVAEPADSAGASMPFPIVGKYSGGSGGK